MYIPAWFRINDLAPLHSLIEQFSFATLVSLASDGTRTFPFASHLPFLLDVQRGKYGTLRGHMARANPQWQRFAIGAGATDTEVADADDQEALVIFQGPHAYISPSWYVKHPAVPTWNYAVVHAYGTPRLLDDIELRATLRDTVLLHEAVFAQPWTMDDLSNEYIAGMLHGIVGFEIVITRMEGKFKLSQNRSDEDRAQVIAHLHGSDTPLDVATADWMARTLG